MLGRVLNAGDALAELCEVPGSPAEEEEERPAHENCEDVAPGTQPERLLPVDGGGFSRLGFKRAELQSELDELFRARRG